MSQSSASVAPRPNGSGGEPARDHYVDDGTRMTLVSASNAPQSGAWHTVEVVGGPEFGVHDTLEGRLGYSIAVVEGTVTDIVGPYEIEFADIEPANDGVFWVDVRVDDVLAGDQIGVGHTLTHPVSVDFDADSGVVRQYDGDRFPRIGESYLFFVASLNTFDGKPYVYIAGAESGRVPTSQISDTLGVDGAHEVAELAKDLLGSERADLNPPKPDAGPPPTTAPAVSLPSGLEPLDEDGS